MKYLHTNLLLVLSVALYSNLAIAQWEQTQELPGDYINALITKDGSIFAGTRQNGIYLSIDNGNHWTNVNNGLTSNYISSFAVRDSFLFAGTYSGVFLSTNNGANWSGIGGGNISCLLVKDTTIFAGTIGGGIVRSTDNGKSWQSINNGINLSIIDIHSMAISNGNIYASAYISMLHNTIIYSGIFLSTNNGDNWVDVTHELSKIQVNSFAVIDTAIFAGTNNGVYLSVNAGTSWNYVSSIFSDYQRYIHCLMLYGNSIIAGTDEYGTVFLSHNRGSSWNDIADHLFAVVYSFAKNDSYLFAGTVYSGVWRRPLSEISTSVRKFSHVLPADYYLAQNYPNPFNPTTIISFGIPLQSMVSLKVYDITGREIKTIVSGYMQAGNYLKHFDASNFPSGIYLYRLQSGTFSETKTFIILR